jgi:arylsulfatase A-like enzyme
MRRLAIALISVGLLGVSWMPGSAQAAQRSPDIILIVSDDQPAGTMRYMPRTREWLHTRFTSAFISDPLCCPSRSAIFSGRYAHDTGVWTNDPEYGSATAFAAWDSNNTSIAEALDAAGYRTALVGKFVLDWDPDVIPSGWDEVALRTGGTPYYSYRLRGVHNGEPLFERHGDAPEDYSTYVLRDKAIEFVRETPAEDPMFLFFAPSAPHGAEGGEGPIPAPEDVDVPVELPKMPPSFNERGMGDKPLWMRELRTYRRAAMKSWRQQVARTLMSLDRSVDAILRAQLERDPGFSNTVVLFISDNGFEAGTHRLKGKGDPYEGAIHVPLLMRAPGVLGGVDGRLAVNIDIAPTIADAAGIAFDSPDGLSLLGSVFRDHLVLEGGVLTGHAYCGVRTADQKYIKYETGEEEFYNLRRDPYELRNRPNKQGAAELAVVAAEACWPLPPEWPRAEL